MSLPPRPILDLRRISENTASIGGNLLSNDRDPEGEALSLLSINGALITGPTSIAGTYGTLLIGPDGAYEYVLNTASPFVDGLAPGDVLQEQFVQVVADASGNTAPSVLVISIEGRNDRPAAADDAAAITVSDAPTPLTGNVLGNDSDADDEILRVASVQGDVANVGAVLQGRFGTLIIAADGSYSYVLDPNRAATIRLAAGESAEDRFRYRAEDPAGAGDGGVLVITVTGRNDAPVARGEARSIGEDAAIPTLTGNVLSNDRDPDAGAVLTVAQVNGAPLPAGPIATQYGGIVIAADGTYAYTLDTASAAVQGLARGATAVDVITYEVSDGQGGTASAALTITIRGANDAPIGGPVTARVQEDVTLNATGSVFPTITDIDGDALSVDRVAGRADRVGVDVAGTYGTLRLAADGSYGYALNNGLAAVQVLGAGETLTDTFTFRARDVFGATVTSTVVITIDGTSEGNAPPVVANPLADQSATEGAAFSFTVPANAFTDVDSATLTYSARLADGGALPAWLSFDPATRTFTGTPPQGAAGALDVLVAASDGAADVSDVFALTIAAAASPARIAFGQPLSALTPFDVLVNTTTASDQANSSVANLTSGGFVVSWTSANQDGSGWGVYAQRYNGAGAADGGEVLVNTTTLGDQRAPAVAGLADGGFLVIWTGPVGSDQALFAQRFNAAGVAVGGEVQVNSVSAGFDYRPSVTVLTNGDYVIIWGARDGGGGVNNDIYARVYSPQGVAYGPEIVVNTSTATEQDTPNVAALADGGFVVTWSSFGQDGSSTAIYAQRFAPGGVRFGLEERINTFTAGDQDFASVAGLAGGGYVVTWSSDSQDGSAFGIYAQLFDADGARVGGEVRINASTVGNQVNSHVAAMPDGGYVVSWTGEDPNSTGIFAQRFDAAGRPLGGETLLNATVGGAQQTNPFGSGNGIAVLANGTLVATWHGTGDVFVRRFELGPIAGPEDTALALPISVIPAPGEILTQTVLTGLPPGSLLSAGTPSADGATWTFTGAPPANLSFTPPENYNGSFTLTVTATTTEGASSATATATQQVVVSPVNDAPFVDVPIPDTTAVVGTPFSFEIPDDAFADVEGDALVRTASLANGDPLPSWLTFDGLLTFTGAPPAGSAGALDIAVAADDGEFAASDTFTLTIRPTNGVAAPSIVFNQPGAITPLDPVDVPIRLGVGFDSVFPTILIPRPNDGGFIAVYETQSLFFFAGESIRYQVFDGLGVALGESVQVTPNAPNPNVRHTINAGAALTTTGGFVVTYETIAGSDFSGTVFLQLFGALGGAIGAPIPVETNPGLNSRWSDVITLPNGAIVVAWEGILPNTQGAGVFYRLFDSNGAPLGPEVRAPGELTTRQGYPDLVALQSGGFALIWGATTAPEANGQQIRGLFGQLFDSTGAATTGPTLLTSQGGASIPNSSTELANGDLVVTWLSLDGSSLGVLAQRFTADLVPIGTPELVNADTVGNQQGGQPIALPDGGYIITYITDANDDAQFNLLGQRFDASSRPLGGPVQLNDDATQNQLQIGTARPGGLLLNGLELVVAFGDQLSSDFRRFDVTAGFLGVENGAPIPLPVSVAGSDPLVSVVLTGLPAGSVLSAGSSTDGGQTWTFAGPLPDDLTLTPPPGFGGAITLTVTATSAFGGQTASTTASQTLTILRDNARPEVVTQVPQQTFTTATVDFTVPAGTFLDPDGAPTPLSFTATGFQGAPLPSWLSFDPLNLRFTGAAPVSEQFTVEVHASDGALSISTEIVVDVTVPNGLITFGVPPSPAALVSVGFNGLQPGSGALAGRLAGDGDFALFASLDPLVSNDNNTLLDFYIRDLTNGATDLVLTDADGEAVGSYGPAAISANGQFVLVITDVDLGSPFAAPGAASIYLVDRINGGGPLLVSATPSFGAADGGSGGAAISADGGVIAFDSTSSNLILDDANGGASDVFTYDPLTGAISLISVSSSGDQGNDASFAPTLSGDGQIIAFVSEADNLVADDSNGVQDIFIRDLATGQTTRVTGYLGEANAALSRPALSANGQFLVFESEATNLVPGDINNASDVFLYSVTSGEIIARISSSAGAGLSANGGSGFAQISADGRFIVYQSTATDLTLFGTIDDFSGTDIFLYDQLTGITQQLSFNVDGFDVGTAAFEPSISADGSRIVFNTGAGDLYAAEDVEQAGSVVIVNRPGTALIGGVNRIVELPINIEVTNFAAEIDTVVLGGFPTGSFLAGPDGVPIAVPDANGEITFNGALPDGLLFGSLTGFVGQFDLSVTANLRSVFDGSPLGTLTEVAIITVVDIPEQIIGGQDVVNSITSGPGPDVLTGGALEDTFIFTGPSQGVDYITNFEPGVDLLEFAAGGFSGIGAVGAAPILTIDNGPLTSAPLPVGDDPQLIFQPNVGQLWWAGDPASGESPVLIAVLLGAATLTSADLIIGAG